MLPKVTEPASAAKCQDTDLADQRLSDAGRGLGYVKRLYRRRVAVIRNLDGSQRQITSRPAYLNNTPGNHSATAGTNNTINSPITWMTMNCIIPT